MSAIRKFDNVIGRLDRSLSEMIQSAGEPMDAADRQTLKHHADDMVGAGNKILKILAASESERVPGVGMPPGMEDFNEAEASMGEPASTPRPAAGGLRFSTFQPNRANVGKERRPTHGGYPTPPERWTPEAEDYSDLLALLASVVSDWTTGIDWTTCLVDVHAYLAAKYSRRLAATFSDAKTAAGLSCGEMLRVLAHRLAYTSETAASGPGGK